MGGDYTRWTFNPARDYSELFKQQGRVDLDADWNEFVEIVNRRWRAETMDIIGRAVVPSFTTPDAFQIIPAGPGQFTIGVGRMYVDGLLAECHGVSPLVYDATLGEVNGSAPVPFNQQPYFPNPTPPPSTGPAVDLIYLDVWQREVTALQDPAIRGKGAWRTGYDDAHANGVAGKDPAQCGRSQLRRPDRRMGHAHGPFGRTAHNL